MFGLRAVAEMQFSDFITCAFDQVVNFAAKCRYRWAPRFRSWSARPPAGETAAARSIRRTPSLVRPRAWAEGSDTATAYDAKGLIKSAIRDNDR